MDGNTERWGQLSAYYFFDDYFVNNPYPTGQGGASVPGFSALNLGRAQIINLSDVRAFGASSVNEFHFSYMRNANNVDQPTGCVGPSLASQGFVTGAGSTGIGLDGESIEAKAIFAKLYLELGSSSIALLERENIFVRRKVRLPASGNHK